MSTTTRRQAVQGQATADSPQGPAATAVARDEALAELQRWRSIAQGWAQRRDDAHAEFDQVQAGAGERILEDPDAADEVSQRLTQLRDRIDAAERAVEAARPRVRAAEAVFLAAEADVRELELAKAREALDVHEARTGDLLAQLREHEGTFVPAQLTPMVSGDHKRAITRLEHQVLILRDMAAGVDPENRLASLRSLLNSTVAGATSAELYPGCTWGPDAVVPAPEFVRSLSAPVELGALTAEVELPTANTVEA